MAKKKDDKPKITIERTYNIPLRKEFQKVPKYKRAKKAITGLRKFLTKHMKSDKIKLGKNLNELIWNNGIKNPPHHVNVTVVKEDNGTVRAELVGKPIYTDKPEKPKKVEAVKDDKKTDIKKESTTKKEEKPKVEEEKSESLEEIAGVSKEEKTSEKKEEEKVVVKEEPKAETKKEEKPKVEAKEETPSIEKTDEKPSKA